MDIVHAEKYYSKIKERFPYLSEKQIENIVKHGLRTFYAYNKIGADTYVQSNYFVAYFGKLFNNNKIYARYALIKKRIKVRILYKFKKTPFNGKYYFGMDEETYKKYSSQIQNARRKTLKMEELVAYKILDEAKLFAYKYIFEWDHEEGKFVERFHDKRIKNFRLIEIRNKDYKWQPVSTKSKHEKNCNKRVSRRA